MWAIVFVFSVPEIGALIRSIRICFFKSYKIPSTGNFLFCTLMESFHVIGVSILMFIILPEIDAIQGAMLTNCMCFIPGVFGLFSRTKQEGKRAVKYLIDFIAILCQITGFIIWPILENRPVLWLIPFACISISCGWWENYVCSQSSVRTIRALGKIKDDLKLTRYFNCMFLSIWKIILFFCSMFVIYWINGDDPSNLLSLFNDGFGPHKIVVDEVGSSVSLSLPDLLKSAQITDSIDIESNNYTIVYVILIQVLASYFCYIFGKFACKILIQGFSYSFPVNLTIPIVVSVLIAACGIRIGDPCFFHGTIPDYLFFESPPVFRLNDFISKQMAWSWILWLLSQTWITLHIWTPKCERLATTEKLFVNPMYSGLLIDQSMALNRRRDDQADVKTEVS